MLGNWKKKPNPKKRQEQTWCIPKSEEEGKKYCGDAENLESTWREAVCAGRNLTLRYHMVKAKFRLWMPPSKLVFLLQRPFGSKGNFTSNKKASRLCFLLACPVSLPPPALCKVMTKKKKGAWWRIFPRSCVATLLPTSISQIPHGGYRTL